MKGITRTIVLLAFATAAAMAQANIAPQSNTDQPATQSATRGNGAHRVPSNAETVSLRGVVDKVQLGAGQGMCFLTVKQGEQEHKVILGSMRYLMSNNFSPKAGEEIQVEGFRLADSSIAAREVSLPGANKQITLRDQTGRPLWAGANRQQKGKGAGRRNQGGGRGPR